MLRMTLVAALLAAILAGCAQVPTAQTESGKPILSGSEALSRYQQGLANYRESRFEAALDDLTAAIGSAQLKATDELNARKHVAFIHCANGRERLCREQFHTMLKTDPDFNLAANESNHPLWGPVWRSIKGANDEQRAVSRAASSQATPALQKLAEGIKAYDGGRYKESLDALQAAIKAGLPSPADEVRARKYSAFVYCLTQRAKHCRNEFKAIFKIDPAFELLPSEKGHPSWASVYRTEKAAATKPASVKKK